MQQYGIEHKTQLVLLNNYQILFFIVIVLLRIFINILCKELKYLDIVGQNGYMDFYKIYLLNYYP